jgi:hypothetical protein
LRIAARIAASSTMSDEKIEMLGKTEKYIFVGEAGNAPAVANLHDTTTSIPH